MHEGSLAKEIDEQAFLYRQVLSAPTCERLIELAYEREFSLELESVDDKPVYQITVVDDGWIADNEMWSMIFPLFQEKLKPLLADLPWLKGINCTLQKAFLKRYR